MATSVSPLSSISEQRVASVTRIADESTAIAELTIVIPTLNERENVMPLLEKIQTVLSGVAWEIIFVDDDSSDGTADTVRAVGRRDSRVRCLQRLGRRGLSSACIEGVLTSSSPYIAVMDADMQHDELLLPQMLQALKEGRCDLAVGSRYIPGGGVGDWALSRASISEFATRLTQAICRVPISDPMSGFFMVRRAVFERSMRRLSGKGFKILLDLIASSPEPLRIAELPYHFRARQHGVSKMDSLVVSEFVLLLADKTLGGRISTSWLMTILVSILAIGLYASVCWVGGHANGAPFAESQLVAVLIAAAVAFFINQLFTHQDKRLSGARLIFRLLLFFFVTVAIGFAAITIISGTVSISAAPRSLVTAGALLSSACSYLIARLVSQPRR